ncbi:uncharacterized protein LOC126855957 isoform X2 [Cataglyphis hispanica]|uniref:uncharacterized protein LOC126855957 isoform X2 n=1 Tax=Cataglyphis hispanica TaxID=1086592 RepID=UPI00217FA9FF|nr:uncharacterized protein LOC126855957 isoform X2 [Cataglyphis hispanica]
MRSHDQHSNVMLKPRRKKSSREKSDPSSTRSSRWSKVTISRDKKLHSKSNDPKKNLFRFDSTVNDSNVVACDIELFCDSSNEERSTCPRISSSTHLEKQANGVCFTCKDCAECQLQQQQQQNCAKIHKTEEDQDKELEHLDYFNTDVSGKTNSTVASNEHEKVPIVVDLTNEDSRKTTWKQTILKRFDDIEESSEMSEPRIMIADSSSKLQRGGTGGSLATALRDRGPCVIPVQPNRSLPIRPAPPIPTRSAASLVTSRSPILKLSNSKSNSQSNLIDVVEMQSDISSSMLMDDLNDFPPIGQQNTSEMTLSLDRSDYILPRIPTNVIETTKEINNVKKKNGEDRDREYEKELTKNVKKRRKSHEVDASPVNDERVKNILKEYSKSCSNNLIDQGERRSQQHLVIRLWDDKRYSSSVMVSTTELEGEKTKEIYKVVPPLRLKKVVCEASTTNEYRNIEMDAGKSRNESNYRIVTGATPRPESPCRYSATSFWSSVVSEKELGESSIRDKSRRSSPKSDDYKIKYRRNRLRQKLRELRGKALELSREMAECDNANDTSPQRSTRLRQMMNCYEKQIENISKLLCKLSASIPSTTDDDVVVDLDYELDERSISVETIVDSSITQVNGVSKSRISPSPSPEPPKLSPRSPIDYERDKSPDTMRNSPPVLPRVYIAIQPTALECLKQNFKSTTESWHAGDNSSSSTIEKDVKMNNTNRTIIRDSVTRASAIVSSVSSEFEDAESSTGEWDREEASPKLKNSEIKEKIAEDTKTFDDVHRQAISPISSDNFLIASTMDLEIDGSNMRDIKEGPTTQIGHLDEVSQILETAASKQIVCEKQEPDQRSNEALSLSCLPIVEETRKVTEYESYNSEENINSEDKTVSAVTAAQDAASTIAIRRPQIPTANVTNILQLQSNYYGSSVARDNVVFTGVIQNSKDAQKVMTSSINQSVALNPTMSLGFTQSGSTVSSSNQQCVVKVIQEPTNQRNDGNRIMTEQFPTLGNWVARMSKKQGAKSKSKLQSGITLSTASTAETARVPGLETQKTRASAPNNTTRNNIVNVVPQWNTERWQRQQHQQRQQQLYATASSATSAMRPGICPPISVTQFYPPNYAIDPYGGAAFGYSAICPYGDYSYHSRLHPTTSSISSYPISPLQDSHPTAPLRQMQHLDKCFPAAIQDAATRHYAATDLLKYPASLSGGYQHAAVAAGLDYDHRLRTATAATQNGTSSACLPSLLLPPPPPLGATAQHGTLTRTALAGYPTANNNQCGRNRMIPDVVAAAAAAAVVAAASFGRQRSTVLPSYGRTDTDMASSDIGSVMSNESSQLLTTDRPAASRECLPQESMQSVAGVNIDSRLNNGSYRQLQNLILDRLPYVKTDDVSYSQPSSAIFGDNAQESTSSVLTSTSYKSAPVFTSNSAITVKEPARKENRNCETPHLGKVNRTLETTSNLECSNCGLTGSMFKCLGCEAVFYCDERCQTRHWSIHVEKCPKRMPKLKKLV